MKTYRGSRAIAPCILDLGARWRWAISFTPQPLYPQGKRLWYLLGRRLGGPQSRSGRGGEEKNSQPLPGFEPPIIQPVAQRYSSGQVIHCFYDNGRVHISPSLYSDRIIRWLILSSETISNLLHPTPALVSISLRSVLKWSQENVKEKFFLC
jgi:hypothetical protein